MNEHSSENKPESFNTKKDLKYQEIVTLNVGGKKFSTSRQTLTWIPDSFFTSLMSGRIPSLKDENGAIFIDRDPESFGPILNFMRTKNVDMRNVDLKILRHEAEYFGLVPLVKRLAVCDELDRSNCGSLLFYCQIKPPVFDLLPTSQESILPTTFQPEVLQITGHGNCIAVAFHHCVCVLGVRESRGWEVIFTTPLLNKPPQRVSLNTRSLGVTSGEPILAAVIGYEIKVWACSSSQTDVLASFDMKLPVDGLFFIGKQLVAISNTGKVVVWQSVQKHWQLQEVEAICSYDTAVYFLLLGCTNGSIYYIDMEKFPVRMKDNDLLVTQLFEDPCKDSITALSVYVTPNVFPGSGQNWMEVAYGTSAGTVRVVVRHPENIGQAPQIFQSYSVHTCPIMRVVLGERHLISVCAENHVRTWTVTRFRGRISTQPGSTPIASFKVLSLEGAHSLFYPINSIGPFGERDEEQVFIQRIIPETDTIFVRSSSTGNRVCNIESVDGSNINAYYVHECDAVNRTGLRSRRFIFTGHYNGNVQVWDLTAALELSHKTQDITEGGPSKRELIELLQNCDVSTASRVSSTFSSRAPSPSPSLMSIIYPSIKATGSWGSNAASLSPLGTPSGGPRRSKGVTDGSIRHNLSNSFQPINVSHSNSTTSLSEVLLPKQISIKTGKEATGHRGGGNGEVKESKATLPEELNLNSCREPEISTKCRLKSMSVSMRREKSDNKPEKVGLTDAEGNSVHQRSRSNEMDYSSLGYDRFASRHSAFKSPTGSTPSTSHEMNGSDDAEASNQDFPSENSRKSNLSLSSDATLTDDPHPREEGCSPGELEDGVVVSAEENDLKHQPNKFSQD